MDQIGEFIGRFHPVLVHLPIGILLLAIAFVWINYSEKIYIPPNVIRLSFAIGAIGGVLSIITGLFLSDSGDYNTEAVEDHMWMGILATALSITLWLAYFDRNVKPVLIRAGSIVLLALLTLAGHRGGSLTHGSDYLTAPLSGDGNAIKTPDLSNIDTDSAVFYRNVVQPLFAARCYSCHGETKQKGGLRLDDPEQILKGGKNGKVLTAGNPQESDLIKRIELPNDDEDHMPPKEKPQFTEQEKKWIELWISTGADFTKKISELATKQQVDELLISNNSSEPDLPKADVPAPDENLMMNLTEQGVSITPVAVENHFLNVSFISIPKETPGLLPSLSKLSRNIVILKLTSTETDDQSFAKIGDLDNLMELSLAKTRITDASMDAIAKLKSLRKLNLESTQVTLEALKSLSSLTTLRYLNVYKTQVSESDHEALKAALPKVTIEFGGYTVPTLDGDTTQVKPKKVE